jgi:hypothetical protein
MLVWDGVLMEVSAQRVEILIDQAAFLRFDLIKTVFQ